MIDLQSVVYIVLWLIIAGAVFALLFWLLNYVGAQFGAEGSLFVRVGRVILVILAVVILICFLISLLGGGPVFRWGPGRVV